MRREVVRHLQGAYGVGERRACSATGFRRSSQRYRSRRDPQVELRRRLRDLAAARVRYGYRRLHVLLRREGWPVNLKRTYRLYSEEGLSIRAKLPRRKRAWRYRVGRPGATAPNEVWSMDFVSDALFDGRPIRILTVLDAHTREALSIVPRAHFRAFNVVAELDRLARERGRPKTLKVDNVLRPTSGSAGKRWPADLGRQLELTLTRGSTHDQVASTALGELSTIANTGSGSREAAPPSPS